MSHSRSRPGAEMIAEVRGSGTSRTRKGGKPRISVRVKSASLERKLIAGITEALAEAVEARAAETIPDPVQVDSPATLRRLSSTLEGKLCVVDITDAGPRKLRGLVAALEKTGCAAIQLSWCRAGRLPQDIEAVLFRIMEERRGRDDLKPVVLTRQAAPDKVWRYVLPKGRSGAPGRTQ